MTPMARTTMSAASGASSLSSTWTAPGTDKGGHLGIKGVHQLFGTLDDGDVQSQFSEIFRRFKADEAATCQNHGFWMFPFYKIPDGQGILHCAQSEQTVQAYTGKGRLHGLCPGGEEQLVIGFLKFLPGAQIPDGDCFALGMDRGYLMPYPHVDAEAPPKTLRCLEGQFCRILDDAADVIGEAAVGIGDVAGPLKDHHFRIFVQTADSRRGGGASRHAAHNDNFHPNTPPFRGMR